MMLGSGFEIADGAPRFLRHAETAVLAPHGFFSAEGGISTGIYASLNCGYGSADDLALVDAVETHLAARLGAGDIRCRVTHSGVRVELPEGALGTDLTDIADMVQSTGRVFAGAAPYKRGSAFLRGAS